MEKKVTLMDDRISHIIIFSALALLFFLFAITAERWWGSLTATFFCLATIYIGIDQLPEKEDKR